MTPDNVSKPFNRQDNDAHIDAILPQLKRLYECKKHPDASAIVIYNCSLKRTKSLCEKYKCSGHCNEELSIAVLTNFYMYN